MFLKYADESTIKILKDAILLKNYKDEYSNLGVTELIEKAIKASVASS